METIKIRKWGFALWVLNGVIVFLKTAFIASIEEFNRENVPEAGKLIVCPNHFSTGEDPAILYNLLGEKLTIIYKKSLEGTNLLDLLPGLFVRISLRLVGFIPASREEKDPKAVAKINYVLLNDGWILGMPEGTSRHTELVEGRRKGLAREALRLDCPILPVALYGTAHALTDGLFGRGKHKISVIYGKRLRLADLGITLENDPTGKRGTTAIMVRIGAMLPEQRRGYYAQEVEKFLASNDLDADYYRSLQSLVHQLG